MLSVNFSAGPEVFDGRRSSWPARCIGAVLSVLMLFSGTAVAEPHDPRELVDSTIERLRAQIVRDEALIARDPRHAMTLVKETVAPHVDMVLASRLVLGRHWQSASKAQREAFVTGLEQLLMRIFALHVRDYIDVEVAYEDTRFRGQNNDRATVRTQVMRPGVPTANVDYRLYRSDAGWKVYDVAIFGVSLIKTYHISIEDELQTRGIDAVIEQINAQHPLPAPPGGAG